jgi:hypothetical protein
MLLRKSIIPSLKQYTKFLTQYTNMPHCMVSNFVTEIFINKISKPFLIFYKPFNFFTKCLMHTWAL